MLTLRQRLRTDRSSREQRIEQAEGKFDLPIFGDRLKGRARERKREKTIWQSQRQRGTAGREGKKLTLELGHFFGLLEEEVGSKGGVWEGSEEIRFREGKNP